VGKPHRRGVISSAHKAVKGAGKHRWELGASLESWQGKEET
jgi:hypothetical protein